MANLFTDTPDLLFHFQHGGLEELADAVEGSYQDASKYPEAPTDAADAVDSYRRVLESLGALAADFIADRADGVDQEGCRLDEEGNVHLPKGLVEDLEMLSRAELMGFTLPRSHGGLNFPNLVYTMAIEIVSRADASLMNLFGLQGIAETIHDFADEDTRATYLPRFSSGEVTGAMVLTEPDAGSDLQRVRLRAVQEPDGTWRLSGVKRFITNGCGDVLLVLARSEAGRAGAQGLSLFLVDKGPAVRVRRLEDKLGIHGSPTCELQFNEAPARLIGKRQRGLITCVMALMNGARVGVAAQAVGIAQGALVAARDYAAVREQFGMRIQGIPAVADMLAEMTLQVEAARALLYDTARVVDKARGAARALSSLHGREGKGSEEERRELKKEAKTLDRLAGLLTPMAKYFASEMSFRVANDAVQILGGSGYMKDYPVERYLRDARITTIYEGTSQLQVVAAIRGITSGMLEPRFQELESSLREKVAVPFLQALGEARQHLTAAVETAKKAEDPGYMDLVARPIVDLAIHVYIAHLLAEQGTHSERKALLAKRWLTSLLLLSNQVHDRVESGERSTLDQFEALVYGSGI